MHELAEIYIELGRDDLLSLIRLQKIFKHLGELACHIQMEPARQVISINHPSVGCLCPS